MKHFLSILSHLLIAFLFNSKMYDIFRSELIICFLKHPSIKLNFVKTNIKVSYVRYLLEWYDICDLFLAFLNIFSIYQTLSMIILSIHQYNSEMKKFQKSSIQNAH